MTPARRLGVDVGGTKCLGVVLGDGDEVLAEARQPTPSGEEELLDLLVEMIGELVAAAGPVASVGIGAPGLITLDGMLRSSPNVPDVTDLHLGRGLGERLGRPVAVGNDATCAALAEWRAGAGRGHDDLIMVTLGTGIGGGIVTGGRLVVGHNGFAGEFGHMVVDPNGPACPCGRRGCWERYASGSGLARLAQDAVAGGRLGRVVEIAGGDVGAVRGEDVQAAGEDGDEDALAVIDEFARWVAIGLVNLTNVFDPALFVLGGGLAEGAHLYLAPIERWFAALLYAPDRRPHPALRFAALAEHAGAVGAALLPGAR